MLDIKKIRKDPEFFKQMMALQWFKSLVLMVIRCWGLSIGIMCGLRHVKN